MHSLPRPLRQTPELLLAEKFDLAVAVVDIHANLAAVSTAAQSILSAHPAFIRSPRRIGVLRQDRSRAFRMALRQVISGQRVQALRIDDGTSQAPLTIQLSSWASSDQCLLSFQSLLPKPVTLTPIQEPYGLSNRQVELLQQFTSGVSLAGIATDLRLRPQYVREAFSSLYAKFDLQNQLQLLSALKSLPLIQAD